MKKIVIILSMLVSLGLRGQISGAELVNSEDEAVFYSALHDISPEEAERDLQYYREMLLSDLKRAGRYPRFDCWAELMHLKVFDNLGNIIKRQPRITNDFHEKTVFDFSELLEEEEKKNK